MNEFEDAPLEEDLPTNIDGKVPQRERQVNIWKSDILFYERIRRENGASVIGIRMERGIMADFIKITDAILDVLSPDDLCTKWNEEIMLLGTWGKDLNQLFRKCYHLTNNIPTNSKGTKLFTLNYAIVMGLPFEELHYNESLNQVLHKVLSLLDNEDINPQNIPYDHFLDMEKSEEQMKRMQSSVVKKKDDEGKFGRRVDVTENNRRLF